MNVRLGRESSLVVASQYVERDSGDEIALRVEAHIVAACALTLVCDPAVERLLRGALGAVDGDVQLQVDIEGEADDIEAGADVGAGAGCSDDE